MNLSPRRALIWSFAERYASFAVSVAGTLVLSRLLTPAEVGVYSLCASLGTVATILRDFGVSEYLIQERELTRDKIRAAFGIALVLAWSLGAAIFFSRGAWAGYFDEPQVAQVLILIALQFVILPFSSPAFALLNREMAFGRLFALQTVCTLAGAATSVTLAWRGHGTMSLAWGPIASVVMQTVVLAWMVPGASFILPSFRQTRTVLRFGSAYMSSRIIETLAKNFHETVIAKRFDFTSVGLFSRAFGLVELFHSNVTDAIVRVATPAFANEHRAGRPLGPALAHATALFVSLSWPFFGFVALASWEIVEVMFGHQWSAAAPLASILAVSAMPAGLYELLPQLLSATGHVNRRLRLSAWVAPFHIAVVLLASSFGLYAIATASFFSSLLMLTLCGRQLHAAVGMRLSDLLRPALPSAVLAAGVIAAMAVAIVATRAAVLPAIVVLLVTLGVGVAGWVLLARSLQHPVYRELHAMMMRRKGAGNKP